MRSCLHCAAQIPAERRSDARYCSKKCCVAACGARWYRASAENKERKRANGERWRKANPEKIAAISSRMYQANKDVVNARTRRWQAANIEKKRASFRKWAAENPEVRAAIIGKRRAAEMMAMPGWLTREQISQIAAIYAVSRRLSLETGVPHQVDHVIPLCSPTVCGLHVPWNLRAIPAIDNQRKRNFLVAA